MHLLLEIKWFSLEGNPDFTFLWDGFIQWNDPFEKGGWNYLLQKDGSKPFGNSQIWPGKSSGSPIFPHGSVPTIQPTGAKNCRFVTIYYVGMLRRISNKHQCPRETIKHAPVGPLWGEIEAWFCWLWIFCFWKFPYVCHLFAHFAPPTPATKHMHFNQKRCMRKQQLFIKTRRH